MDLWQLAESRIASNEASSDKTEKTLLFVGERKSGKSTVLQSFLSYGKEDAPKTTVALEYTFARAPIGVTAKRDIGHMYELGGGRLLSTLTNVVINSSSLPGLAAIISIDLSVPHKVLDSLLFWMQIVKDNIKRSFSELEISNARLARKMKQRIDKQWRGHEDLSQLDIPPIPIIILANKYDIFANEESEKRKWMARTLRYFAHRNGAHLLYITHRDTRVVSAMRGMLNHYVFGLPLKRLNAMEYNNPLLITAGVDSFAQQGPPPGIQSEVASLDDLWMQAFAQMFPKV